MAEAWGSSKQSGQKKIIFNGKIKVYLEKNCFGVYQAQVSDEKHFELWLKHCHTTHSLKRGFGSSTNMFTAVRRALHQLNTNPNLDA